MAGGQEIERPLRPHEVRAIIRSQQLHAQADEAMRAAEFPEGAEVNLARMTVRYVRPAEGQDGEAVAQHREKVSGGDA